MEKWWNERNCWQTIFRCVHKRSISRNTHYLITEDEAVALRLDPRVEAVELAPHNLGLKIEASNVNSDRW